MKDFRNSEDENTTATTNVSTNGLTEDIMSAIKLMTNHYDRAVYCYDTDTDIASAIDDVWYKNYSLPRVIENLPGYISEIVIPGSQGDFRVFCDAIKNGCNKAGCNLQLNNSDIGVRWYYITFDRIYRGSKESIISILDITKDYEEVRMFELNNSNSMMDSKHLTAIVDLTEDVICQIDCTSSEQIRSSVGSKYSLIVNTLIDSFIIEEQRDNAKTVFDRPSLLANFFDNQKNIKSQWGFTQNSIFGWVECNIALNKRDTDNHIIMRFDINDVSNIKEEYISYKKDGELQQTVLSYNSFIVKETIRGIISNKNKKPGALVILAMSPVASADDANCNVRHTNIEFIRSNIQRIIMPDLDENDIAGDIAGGRIIVYIRSMGSKDILRGTIHKILHSLDTLSSDICGVVTSGEWVAGCTVCTDGDFDSAMSEALYALEYIDMHPNLNCAIYDEIEEQSGKEEDKSRLDEYVPFEQSEFYRLLSSMTIVIPTIISANVSEDFYYMMEQGADFSKTVPVSGSFGELIYSNGILYHPDDRSAYYEMLNIEKLTEANDNGDAYITFEGRKIGVDRNYHWMRNYIIFGDNPLGDLCITILEQPIDEDDSLQNNMLRLDKVIQIAVNSSLECIGTIDLFDGKWETCERNTALHTHNIKYYDAQLELIMNLGLTDVETSSLIRSASLETVVQELNDNGYYSYYYTVNEVKKEASFYYYEPSHRYLLMTIGDNNNDEIEKFNTALAILRLDASQEFSIKSINREVLEILKDSRDQFMDVHKHNVFGSYHPDDRLRSEKLYRENAIDGAEFIDVARIFINREEYIWIEFSVAVYREGDIFLYYINCRDISHQKKLQSEIEHFETMVTRSRMHTWEYNLYNDTILLASKGGVKIDGAESQGEFPSNLIISSIIHPSDVDEYISMCQKIKSGSKYEEIEIRIKNEGTKSFCWRKISYTTMFDVNNQPMKALGISEDIEKIKNVENRFKMALRTCSTAIWNYDIENHCVSKTFYMDKLMGIEGEVIENVPASILDMDIVHPDDLPDFISTYRALDAGALETGCQIRLRKTHCDKYRWFKIYHTVVTDEDGKALYAVGCAVNVDRDVDAINNYIGEVKQLIEISDEGLLAKCCVNITNNTVDSYRGIGSIIVCDSETKYSETASKLNKLYVDEAHKKYFEEKLYPEGIMRSFAKGVNDYTVEYRRLMLNGDYCWVKTKVNIFANPLDGNVMCFLYTYDTNQEKLSQLTLSRIVDDNYDFVAYIDKFTQKYVPVINSKTCRINVDELQQEYGKALETYAIKHYKEFNSIRDFNVVREMMQFENVRKSIGNKSEIEYTIKMKPEGIREYCTYRITMGFLDKHKSKLIMCITDMTKVIMLEQRRQDALRRALDEAKAANKAKSEFLSRMSHDIRTPLNGIMGMTEIALRHEKGTDIDNCLDKINTSSQFLMGLIDDMLDMNKIESGKMTLREEPYNANEFKKYIDAVIVPICNEKNIEFICDTQSDCTIITDKMRFNQIFFNLLNNAVKFTSPGGKVSFISRVHQEQSENLESDIASMHILVKDTGIGMSHEFMEHMYEPFAQEYSEDHLNDSGTGMGLAIVNSIVELMGGTIEAQSELGEGTTFIIDLKFPIEENVEKPHSEQKEKDYSEIINGCHVLFCEDNMLNAEITGMLLEQKGVIVDYAENGLIGLNKFKASSEGFYDVVLMDRRMPVMNGIESSRNIRKLNRRDAKLVPIIAITADAYDADRLSSLEAGINMHLAKPLAANDMYKAIAECLVNRTK